MIAATVMSLTEQIESLFPVGQATATRLAITGEPYVTIAFPAEAPYSPDCCVREGQKRELAFDEETACTAAAQAFTAYALGKRGTLYWRTKPELSKNDDGTSCGVYMRLLISDRAALERSSLGERACP